MYGTDYWLATTTSPLTSSAPGRGWRLISSINQYTEFLIFHLNWLSDVQMWYWLLTVYALIEGRKSLIQQHWMNVLEIQRQLWLCSMPYMRFMRVSTRVDQDWCMTYNSLHWDLGEETYLKFMKLVPGEHSALLGLSLNIYSLCH
jgi:hypothetical protein